MHFSLSTFRRVRQRSSEGVMRRNGRPKGCFWRVRFISAPLRFTLQTLENLNGAEKKRTLQNTLLDDHFSARRLRRSFGASPISQRGLAQVSVLSHMVRLNGLKIKIWSKDSSCLVFRESRHVLFTPQAAGKELLRDFA